ncbi:MAG: flippase [Desulfobacterales bacterium]|nr:flippase [Desulfobacterales bacterium]
MSQPIAIKSFKKYFFNTGWLMADKVLRLFVGLFVGVYVARYLGPERFGLLSFALSFVALFGAFARLGLDNIVVRNVVIRPETRDELLGTAFGLRMIGGLILFGFVFFVIRLTDSDPLTRLLVMIIALGHILQAFQIFEFYFNSQVMARLVSIAGISGLLTSSAIKLILIWSGASLVWFAWVFVIEHGIKGIVLCTLYVKRRIPLKNWRFRLSQAKYLLKDSWPLILSGLVIMVYMRIDQVMIKQMLDADAVGHYAAAVRLSEAWYFVPMAITQSLFPAILSAKKQSEELYYTRLQQLYDLVVWLAIAIAIPVTFLGDWIVTLLFGVAYQQAGAVLAIHIWAGLFVAMGVASGRWLITENLQMISAKNAAIGSVVNVILNIFLIKCYGIIGAALSTVISYGCAAYFGLMLHKVSRINFYYLTNSFNFFRILRKLQN